MAGLNDPDDRRTMGEKLLEFANAWTEAMDEINKKLQEEQARSQEDKDLIDRMIVEARAAVKAGHTIEKFQDD